MTNTVHCKLEQLLMLQLVSSFSPKLEYSCPQMSLLDPAKPDELNEIYFVYDSFRKLLILDLKFYIFLVG